ncbi:MAG TPA: CHAT domain-containing protein [Gammaproteobacteria bacterium]|nr:CHAT domain-containing protein [Gammaproteobacteria bacterium]
MRFIIFTFIFIISILQTTTANNEHSTLSPEVEEYFNVAKELEAKGDRRSKRKIQKESVEPLMDYAEAYYDSNNYNEAIIIYKRLYDLQKRLHGERHRKTQYLRKKLAYVYHLAGRFTEQAEIEKSILDSQQRPGRASRYDLKMMSKLAFTYKQNKDYVNSEALYLKALKIYEDNKMTQQYTYKKLLYELSSLYIDLGDYARAEPYYRRSLGIKEGEEIDINKINITKLFNYAHMLQFTGKYAEVEDLYKKMLKKLRQRSPAMTGSGVFSQEPQILASLGNVYNQTGAYGKALEFNQKAYSAYKNSLGQEHVITAYALANLAETYLSMGEYTTALNQLKSSAAILKKQVKKKHQVYIDKNFIMPHLALAYSKTGDYDRAEEIYLKVLEEISKEYSPRHPLMTYSQINLAEMYYFQNRLEPAIKLCLSSLGNAINNRAPYLLSKIYFTLAKIRQKQKLFAEAIFYGKQGVNKLQQIRTGLLNTEESLQKSFIDSQQDNYKMLAGWLVDAARLSEAEQVLAMLKEEEYFNFIRRSDKNQKATLAQLNLPEQKQETRLTRVSHRLATYSNELSDLEKISDEILSNKDRQRIKDLHVLIAETEKAFQSTLIDIKASFNAKDTHILAAQIDNKLYNEFINRPGQNVALIHFLPLKNDLRIILRTSKLNITRKVEVSSKQFNQNIDAYRKKIKRADLTSITDKQELDKLSQQLYQWLFKPVEKELQQANIKNIMLYKNGILRYIPLATLYDGQKYLVEKYAISNYTAAAKASFKNSPQESWMVAGMGVSKQYGEFSPLHMVPFELDSIVKKNSEDMNGIFKGDIFINEKFTATQFRENLKAPYNVGHIATHYKFMPGTEADSFLLMGDGSHLTLATLRKKNYNFEPVELLTLSACETAAGDIASDGREIEGLATLVQRQGAKAVMATLWPVADCSTGLFMQRFYQYRSTGIDKAAALRQSQLDFIQKKVPAMAVSPRQPDKGCQPLLGKLKNHYTHPYFWAPFILMGNWQ